MTEAGPTTDGAAHSLDPIALVVIPTYNERENLEAIVKRVRVASPSSHILIVDDGSPDGTGAMADGLAAASDQIHVMHRTEKAGLGAAYIAAFTWGLAQTSPQFEVIVEMDADGSHAPEHLPAILEASRRADVVIGSRWVPGGEVVNWPRSREALSRGGNLYTRLALGIAVRDATAGFRAYRAEVLRAIDLGAVESQGYCFQVDMTYRCVQDGYRIVEVPITFVERERGDSKMGGAIVREALIRVTEWGAAKRWNQAKGLVKKVTS